MYILEYKNHFSEMRYLFNVVITFARVWIWLSSINTHRVT